MKQMIMAIVLCTVTATAYADNTYAGRCAALNLQLGNTSTAKVAMNVADNKGKMQIAARKWMDRLGRDEKGAIKSGVLACNLIGIKM
jgi:hypothetical protein